MDQYVNQLLKVVNEKVNHVVVNVKKTQSFAEDIFLKKVFNRYISNTI